MTYVGQGTVLIEMDGLRILTDPVLKRWMGPLRRYGELPDPGVRHHIDVVLISHLHLDHLDTPFAQAAAQVGGRDRPPAHGPHRQSHRLQDGRRDTP